MDEDDSPGMMLIEEQARRRAERHELEEQARRRREAHLSWPRSLTWERRREHNIMPGLEEHVVPAFAGQRDISRARLRHQQASLLEHRHRLLSIDEHVQDMRRMRDRSRMRLMSWTCSSIESKRCRCSRSEACWWRRRARLISRCPANAGTTCSSRPGMMLCSRRRSQVNDRGQERWASRRRLACSSSSWRSARRRACSSMSIIPGESSSSMCSLCWGTLPAQGAEGKTADLKPSYG